MTPETYAPTGPLRGLRVLEFGGVGPAPFCAMLLSDLGADVLRIERPSLAPKAWMERPLRRGRLSVGVDLKHPDAPEFVLGLIAEADALIEGFRPGVMERLALGPDACFARNARLVYGRVTGWGQSGPYAGRPSHDLNYVSLSGALASIGRAGERPVPPLNLVGDFGGGGFLLALGIVSALLESRESGRGQVVDAAMIDGSALMMTMVYELHNLGEWSTERGSNLLDGGAPFYDVYECSDGRTVAVACLESRFYAELLRLLDLGHLRALDYMNPANWPVLREALTAAFATRTSIEVEEIFAGAEACVTLLATLTEAPANEHNVARGVFYESPDGPLPSPAPRFSRTPAAVRPTGGTTGPLELDVLQTWGVAETELAALINSGILANNSFA